MVMLLSCALGCFGAVFRPFEYGCICLFALPRLKKPPDLVSEGGKVRCSLFYDSRYNYYIRRQHYMRKVLRMHHLRKSMCHNSLRSTRNLCQMRTMETSVDLLFGACSNDIADGDCSGDIPFSDDPYSNMIPTTDFNEPIVMLRRDRAVFDRLKSFAWTAGASVNLDSLTARVLQDTLDSSINLASGLTVVIFDTGASWIISNNKADFPYGIEPLQC